MNKKLLILTVLITTVSLMTACTPTATNQVAQQQNYVCKSLINGFLKTQSLGQYEYVSMQPSLNESSEQRTYIYKTPSDTNIHFNMPSWERLTFRCDINQQQYALQLLNEQQQIHLMTLNMPKQQELKQWTVSSLKHEK